MVMQRQMPYMDAQQGPQAPEFVVAEGPKGPFVTTRGRAENEGLSILGGPFPSGEQAGSFLQGLGGDQSPAAGSVIPPPAPSPDQYATADAGRQVTQLEEERADPFRDMHRRNMEQQAFMERAASASRDEDQAQMNMRSVGGDVSPYDVSTSPVDPYSYDMFDDTWAEGTNQNTINMLATGTMKPDQAVYNILDSQGLDGYQGNRAFLEQMYQYEPIYNQLANPGTTRGSVTDDYVAGGDLVNKMMGPAGGENGFGTAVDPRSLWDNAYSDAGIAQFETASAGADNPADAEYEQVLGAVEAMAPWMPEQTATTLTNRVTEHYYEYQSKLGMEIPADVSFVQYLRDNGAEEWL